MKAIGYARISRASSRRPDDPYGLAAQRHDIEAWAEAHGHEPVGIETDTASGKTTKRRPGLERTLAALENGAELLIVAKLDRLSRSALDFARLVERSQRGDWSLAALDVGVDTSTANGELVAGILVQVAQWERRIIAQRTREALAEARESGVRLGRESNLPSAVTRKIKRRRSAGWTLARIADKLNDENVATAHGGRQWWPSTVRAVLARTGR